MFGWFKRKTVEPATVAYVVPSDDEIIATAPHTIGIYQNVARGTFGYSLLRLSREGRLKCTQHNGILPDETYWTYEASK